MQRAPVPGAQVPPVAKKHKHFLNGFDVDDGADDLVDIPVLLDFCKRTVFKLDPVKFNDALNKAKSAHDKLKTVIQTLEKSFFAHFTSLESVIAVSGSLR